MSELKYVYLKGALPDQASHEDLMEGLSILAYYYNDETVKTLTEDGMLICGVTDIAITDSDFQQLNNINWMQSGISTSAMTPYEYDRQASWICRPAKAEQYANNKPAGEYVLDIGLDKS